MAKETLIFREDTSLPASYSESIKSLRTSLYYAGKNIKSVMVTSSFPNEGKSDTAFHLAQEMGNNGKRTLLIDADLRKPTGYAPLRNPLPAVGLVDYLAGKAGVVDMIYHTSLPHMDLIPSGRIVPNPSELLDGDDFSRLIQMVSKVYDIIIVDTPPLLSVSDPMIISRSCDGALLVVKSDATSKRAVKRSVRTLAVTNCRLLGAVLNCVNMKRNSYYSKYGNYYGYGVSSRK